MSNTVAPKLSGIGSGFSVKTYNYGGSLKASSATSIYSDYEQIDYNIDPDVQKAKNITSAFDSDQAIQVAKAVGATAAVAVTSVLSGVLKLGEKLLDGGAWVAKLFCPGNEKIKEFIARDLVGEANKKFYDGTELGRAINATSAMKYDGKVAQGIQKGTEWAAEFAAATALTVATGGAAAPMLAGTVVGLGTASQTKYIEKGTNTSLKDEALIAGQGLLNGVKWVFNGKIGSNLWSIHKVNSLLGGPKAILSQIRQEVFTKDFLAKSLKKGLASKQAIFNYLGSGANVSGDVISIVKGQEELNLKTGAKIAGKFIGFLGLSVISDAFRDYLGSFVMNDEAAKAVAARIVDPNTNVGISDLDGINKKNLSKIYAQMTDQEKLQALYDDALQVARGKYNPFFRNFREHGAGHSAAVRDYATQLGLECGFDSQEMADLYYSAQFHDAGMASGGVFFDESIGKWVRIDSMSINDISVNDVSKYLASNYGITDVDQYMLQNYGIKDFSSVTNKSQLPQSVQGLFEETLNNKMAFEARGNHSMYSAMKIITDDLTPNGVDKNKAALLALSHGKSTSGITDFTNKDQWKGAVEKLKQAMVDSGDMSPTEANKMEKELLDIIDDDKSFDILRKQAVCLRDADAMSEVYKVNGRLVMQTGEQVETTLPRVADTNSGFPPKNQELSGISDKVYNSDGTPKIDSNGNQVEITNEFSKGVHAGESNVSFSSNYDGSQYSATIKIDDPLAAPNSTVSAINERVAEVATYDGIGSQRDVKIKIDVPEDSELGKAYKKQLAAKFASQQKSLAKKGADKDNLASFYNDVLNNIEWAD